MVESYSNGFMYGKNCGAKANNSKQYVLSAQKNRTKIAIDGQKTQMKSNTLKITSKIKNQPNGIKEIKSKTIPQLQRASCNRLFQRLRIRPYWPRISLELKLVGTFCEQIEPKKNEKNKTNQPKMKQNMTYALK